MLNCSKNQVIPSTARIALAFCLAMMTRHPLKMLISSVLIWIFSVQNKLDALKLLNRDLKSQVIFLSEIKIGSSYKDDQFL
ncbi:hypothetical protein P5673_023480 [Acropora cervicornis]|uniref:Uncharacterized protein n=1 Tax=Acropora cervicornis TaxID=6130 RepID=A0AAD9UYP4_ACRCE|nr:hypothetical protein P5673_023480 [Acropora cervicornis]